MITWENIRKAFRGRPAVHELSLRVEPGEIFGLLGHNGAGKSTSFGIALGQVRADAGRVLIGGHDVALQRGLALARVGAIFESPRFYDYLSGWRNLQFLVSLGGPTNRKKMEEVIELVGLTERIHDPVRAYSHGMRQRLALAQALLPEPNLLLLDEPTEGLDPTGIHEIRTLLLHLRESRGLTIVLSSHLLPEVERLCDRVAILHQGRLLFCGPWTEAHPPRWHLQTSDPETARALLARHGFALADDGEISPLAGGAPLDEITAEKLLTALIQDGLRLSEFRRDRPTLEDFYLQTIGQ